MNVSGVAYFLPGVDQALMERIELIGPCRKDLPRDALFEPGPLEHRGFEDRGWRIGIVLQQFRRSAAVETEIEPAIKAGFVTLPAIADQRPEDFLYLQAAQRVFVVDRAADQFEAHRVDFACRGLDLVFDFVEREGVVGAFVPIAFAVDGMKIESAPGGGG